MTRLIAPIVEKDHRYGKNTAPIILVEYGDYECSYCALAQSVIHRLQKYYGERLQFIYRHFPLIQIHPHAEIAAETAEYAAAHKRFWDMHRLIYENQSLLSMKLLLDLAEELNLPVNQLQNALENRTYQLKVKADFMSGMQSGVHGTPAFFINGYRYRGAIEFEELVAEMNQEAILEL